MKRRIPSLVALPAPALGTLLAGGAGSQDGGLVSMALTADEMHWSAQGGLALPGMDQVNLVGEPGRPGPYTIRLRFPAGYKLAPHTHPDSRRVTVLSGTWMGRND
jgi:hypothetical protein